MGLVPIGEVPDALWFGIGVHEALAEWYKKGKRRGPHPADTFEAWSAGAFREIRASREDWDDEARWEDACELGVAMLENYVETWGKDPQWTVLATEQPFSVRVIRKGQPVAIFRSRFDGVVRDEDDGRPYLLEHKTAGAIVTAYLELDDQGGSYWAVATQVLRAQKLIGPSETLAGIVYNFLRKAKPDERPQNEGGAYLNKNGTVSKKQPSPYFVRHLVEREPGELVSQMNRMADQVAIMNGMRDGTIPIVKNPTKDCPWCQFFSMCKLQEQGNDAWLELMNGLYVQQDPYADNLKSAAE